MGGVRKSKLKLNLASLENGTGQSLAIRIEIPIHNLSYSECQIFDAVKKNVK